MIPPYDRLLAHSTSRQWLATSLKGSHDACSPDRVLWIASATFAAHSVGDCDYPSVEGCFCWRGQGHPTNK